MITAITYRTLSKNDVSIHRDLVGANPDLHLDAILRSFPRFQDMARYFDPDETYWMRQRLILGAFDADRIVGTVAIQCSNILEEREFTDREWACFFDRFSEHELDVYNTWTSSYSKTFLLAPENSLTLHSLAVSASYRRNGIARKLIEKAASLLERNECEHLYTETARVDRLVKMFRDLRFKVVRKSFSWSERLEYGQWGSVLMQYEETRG